MISPVRLGLAAAAAFLMSGVASAQPVGRGPLFVSPAGAVFRTDSGHAIAAWFAQADTNRDGAIDWTEFQADFERAFVSFDVDGDGEIEPDEVTRYETEILPEMSGGVMAGRRGVRRDDGNFGPGGRNGGPRPRARSGAPGTAAMMSGAARFGVLAIPHPIMDADSNFNRGVTRPEWLAAAQTRFNALNRNNDGLLRLDAMQRPDAPPPAARRTRD